MKRKGCILQFKRKMNIWIGYREEATDRAKNQNVSWMNRLEKGRRCKVHLAIIAGSMCDTKIFNDNMKLLGVVESKYDDIRRRHVFKLMEEQDRALRTRCFPGPILKPLLEYSERQAPRRFFAHWKKEERKTE